MKSFSFFSYFYFCFIILVFLLCKTQVPHLNKAFEKNQFQFPLQDLKASAAFWTL